MTDLLSMQQKLELSINPCGGLPRKKRSPDLLPDNGVVVIRFPSLKPMSLWNRLKQGRSGTWTITVIYRVNRLTGNRITSRANYGLASSVWPAYAGGSVHWHADDGLTLGRRQKGQIWSGAGNQWLCPGFAEYDERSETCRLWCLESSSLLRAIVLKRTMTQRFRSRLEGWR